MDNRGFEPDVPQHTNDTAGLRTNRTGLQPKSTQQQRPPNNSSLDDAPPPSGKTNVPETCLCTTGQSVKTKVDENDNSFGLQRQVGLVGSTSMIVGTIIGSGIFVTPGSVLQKTGSVWLSIMVWIACGIVSAFGAMVYIELATVVPSSGAEYSYLLKAFGPVAGFLFSWVSTLILKPSSVAIGGLAVAQYSVQPFVSDIESVELTIKLVCVVTICILTYINCISSKFAAQVQIVFTVTKLVAFVIIIGGGLYNIFSGKTEHLQTGFQGSIWNVGSLASAFYGGLWAYDGWNQLNYITEEIKDPYTNLPRAILIGLPLITVCYVMVNISFLTLLSPEEMIHSSSVAVVYGNRLLGVLAFIMPLSVICSTFGSANGTVFTSARLCYAASREGHLVDFLCYIDVNRNTPSLALIFNSFIAVLMALTLDISGLIDFFSFTAWTFYGCAIACVIKLRYTMKDAPRPFKVPLWIPYVMVLLSVYLVLAPILEDPRIEYLYATVFLFSGLPVYYIFCHKKMIIPGMEIFTIFLQLMFQTAPPPLPTANNDPPLISVPKDQPITLNQKYE